MQKQHSWPEGHWNWPIKVTHKHGVRCGDMVWIGGQVNLSPDGVVLNPDDLAAQTAAVVQNISTVLKDFGTSLTELVYLNAFYVNNGSISENDFLGMIASSLPQGTRTTITPVPVPYLAYERMLVEIEAYVMCANGGETLPRQYAPETALDSRPDKFCTALKCGKMIFTSAQSAIDSSGHLQGKGSIVEQSKFLAENLRSSLNHFGADFDDVVKTNRWYCGGDDIDDFEPAALDFAANFTEPGPAATGIPLPRHADPEELIRVALIAMIGENGERLPRRHAWPDSLWDWHVHLPYKHGLKCDNMIFLGGQVSLNKKGQAVHPNDLTAQTHQAMTHIKSILNELGADYQDVCKVMTLYQGGCGAEALNSNLPIRSSYFECPGPATTGIPLPVLAYESMCIEIDIYAMAEAD
ncbi:MAG: enamine deaminase RidA (YjgF/YER057c/UK114 family) [Gammaproteobacteria bacterium]|jgi:enamine deaminase RidA (YjgF/YER057c/UK114 family)